MKHYDCMVVGSGISGMTMSLLLAGAGKKVLLVEKSRRLGGSMQRFVRDGIPFDTGFHFTTALDGVLSEMLRALNIADLIRSKPFDFGVYLADRKTLVDMPPGRQELQEHLCGLYPAEAEGIRQYFEDEDRVFQGTPWLSLAQSPSELSFSLMDEDFISLDSYCDDLGISAEVRCLLTATSVCHGTPPSQISVANHFRIAHGLHDRFIGVHGGGAAFIAGFRRESDRLGIEVRTSTEVAELLEIEKRQCHSAVLSDGSRVGFDECVMAVHPAEILKMFPAEVASKELRRRVDAFEESVGFFSIFARLTEELPEVRNGLTSHLTHTDFNRIMSRSDPASALAVIVGDEELPDRHWRTVTAFEVAFPEELAEWSDTLTGNRGAAYLEYKARRQEQVEKKIYEIHPSFEGRLQVLDTATILTYRDYLSPYGSAYGVAQKVGQSNVFGRLPIRNFYAVGQSAMVPGVLGAMLSSFVIFRRLGGPNYFNRLVCGGTDAEGDRGEIPG